MLRRFRRPPPAPPVPVVLYTRAACPLCERMEAEIERAGRARQYTLRLVDVDSDRALKKRFGLSVPVLEIAGEVAFEGRLTARAFRDRLDAARRAPRS